MRSENFAAIKKRDGVRQRRLPFRKGELEIEIVVIVSRRASSSRSFCGNASVAVLVGDKASVRSRLVLLASALRPAMPSPFNQFVGRGAALWAMGRAAQQASIAAGSDGGARVDLGGATAHAWPLPVLATVGRQPALDGGDGFFKVARAPSKAARRDAGKERAVEKQGRANAPTALRRAREEAEAEEGARLLEPLAAADVPTSKRRRSVMAAAILHEEMGPPDQGFIPQPLSDDMQRQFNLVLGRWREFEADMAAAPMTREMWRQHMAAGYPSSELTLKFVKWLLGTRKRRSLASRREGHELQGRHASSVKQSFTHMRNHVWPTLYTQAGFPTGAEAREYWRPVRMHVDGLVGGGGGGSQALARVVQAGAEAAQEVAGASEATVQAAGASGSCAAQLAVRAATMPITTREHLNQTGEYILQDALLSEPFEVNEAAVLNAYMGFARQTGCRPGMALNVVQDVRDPNGQWANVPPLIVADLLVGKFESALPLTRDGEVTASFYFEVAFERVKGQYFSNTSFGTAVTPDSDEAVRLATAGLLRLLLRTAAPRAVYAKLSASNVVALRHKVDAPEGFDGLSLADTKYESWAALVAACCEDDWVMDEAALERALFPAVDRATGRFLLGSGATYDGGDMGSRLNEVAVELGYHKSTVGAWSLRKDACDVVAQGPGATDTMTAARVLGHRRVNSRTMDRVYRADLRRRDLGRYWRMLRFGETEEAARAEPLKSPSAQRVPAAVYLKSFSELPEHAPERAAVEKEEEVVLARKEEAAAISTLLEAVKADVAAAGGDEATFKQAVRSAEKAVRLAVQEARRGIVRRERKAEGSLHRTSGGVRKLSQLPPWKRKAVAEDEKVVAAKAKLSAARVKLAGCVGLSTTEVTAAVKHMAKIWSAGRAALAAYEETATRRATAVTTAQRVALGDYQARIWHEGQEKLRRLNGLRKARCSTHSWPRMSEQAAIAWGLERLDRTVQLKVLKHVPRRLQWGVVDAELLERIPTGAALLEGTGKQARAFDAVSKGVGTALCMRCYACGALRALPSSAAKLQAAACSCGETMACEALSETRPSEAHGVWLALCAAGRLGKRSYAASAPHGEEPPSDYESEADEAEQALVQAAEGAMHTQAEELWALLETETPAGDEGGLEEAGETWDAPGSDSGSDTDADEGLWEQIKDLFQAEGEGEASQEV